MQFSVEVPDKKVSFFLELVKNLRFVKIKPVSVQEDDVTAEQLKAEIKEAVNEVKQARKGRIQLPTLNQFLDEL